MAAYFKVKGGPNAKEAHVISHEGLNPGLMVYTHPADHYEWGSGLLLNAANGSNLAVNPSGSPTLTLIHNGGDTAAWTAAAVTGGGFDFASTTVAFDGTQSIDATVSANNDVAGFTAPAPLNPQTFSDLRFYMYITAWDTRGTKDVTFQWLNGGTPVGVSVNVTPYVDVTLLNTWQLVDIPISDFQLSTTVAFDELQVTTVDQGQGTPPDYYLDAINLVSSATGSGTLRYVYTPEYGTRYNLLGLTLQAYNSSKQKLTPTEFFGLSSLTNGCVLNYRDKERVFVSLIFRDVWDMLRIGSAQTTVEPDASSGASFAVRFNIPSDQLRIDGSSGQYIELIVRDNLSSLDRFMVTLDLEKYIEES